MINCLNGFMVSCKNVVCLDVYFFLYSLVSLNHFASWLLSERWCSQGRLLVQGESPVATAAVVPMVVVLFIPK